MPKNKYAGKKCFVIMPFGKKKDVDGTEVDFDYVYHNLIEKAVEELGIDCERCDEIIDTGSIHFKMFHGIFEADVAVVDITSLNANVFYELGIRHALNKHVTLIISKAGTNPPFNIRDLNTLPYSTDTVEEINKAKVMIQEHIKNGLDKLKTDSFVHLVLDNLKVERKSTPIKKTDFYSYEIKGIPEKLVGIVTGDIQNIKNIDIWVNSENTNMQMARHYDRSISGTIRYMGAKKDAAKRVTEDVIANELGEIVGNRGVDPAIVIATGAGELTKTNGVKKIFHAAAVRGQVGRGYLPIPDIDECVRNALELADSPEMENEDLHSIVFPLMGTGTTKLSAQGIANKLIDTAVSYIEDNPDSQMDKIYFLAYNNQDFELCEHTFVTDPRIKTPEGTL
jgi:O-acetyl-ADP-ribose deacetylase (regulator of RNase III)